MFKKSPIHTPTTTTGTGKQSLETPLRKDSIFMDDQVFKHQPFISIFESDLMIDFGILDEEKHITILQQLPQAPVQTIPKPLKNSSYEALSFLTKNRYYSRNQGIVVVNHKFNILYADKHAIDLMGVNKKQLHKHIFTDLIYEEDKKKFLQGLEKSKQNPRYEFDYLIYYNNRAKKLINAQQFENPSKIDIYYRYLKGIRTKIVEMKFDIFAEIQDKTCFINPKLVDQNKENGYFAFRMSNKRIKDFSCYNFSKDSTLLKMGKKLAASKIAKKKLDKDYPKIQQQMEEFVSKAQKERIKKQEKQADKKKKKFGTSISNIPLLLNNSEIRKAVKQFVPNSIFKNKKKMQRHIKYVERSLLMKKKIHRMKIELEEKKKKERLNKIASARNRKIMKKQIKLPVPARRRARELRESGINPDIRLNEQPKLIEKPSSQETTFDNQPVFEWQEIQPKTVLSQPNSPTFLEMNEQYQSSVAQDFMFFMLNEKTFKEPTLPEFSWGYDEIIQEQDQQWE